jgi:hypothetical protein
VAEVLVAHLLVAVEVQVEPQGIQVEPAMEPVALAVAMVVVAALEATLLVDGVAMAQVAVFASSGPAQLAFSHQLIRGTCNGTLYSHKRWATV